MVASNNSGGFRPTADVRRALADAGFAFRAPEISWNAPANHSTQARNETAQREAEERQKAQEAIENNVTNIRSALANPNIDQATRAKLEADLGKLEGLRTQLDGGRATAAQVSASVASITSSVSATVSSVSAGGAASFAAISNMSAGQFAALEQRYGFQSMSAARTPEEAQSILRNNFAKVSATVDANAAYWRSKGINLGTQEEQDELAKAKKAAESGDPHAVLRYTEMQRQLNERIRAQTNDPNDHRRLDHENTQLGIAGRQAQDAISHGLTRQQSAVAQDREQARATDVLTQQLNRAVEITDRTRTRNDTQSLDALIRPNTADTVSGNVANAALEGVANRRQGRFGAVVAANGAVPGEEASRAQNPIQTATAPTQATTEQKPAEAAQVAANEQTKEAAREAARPAAQAQVKPDGEASKTEAAKPTQVAAAAPAAQSAAAARA